MSKKIEVGFGVSIEVNRSKYTPKEVTGLVIYNDETKHRQDF